jgi:hypothetical protein
LWKPKLRRERSAGALMCLDIAIYKFLHYPSGRVCCLVYHVHRLRGFVLVFNFDVFFKKLMKVQDSTAVDYWWNGQSSLVIAYSYDKNTFSKE